MSIPLPLKETLFVGNLSYFCTDDALHELFRPFGTVYSALVRRSNQNTPCHYGFVELAAPQTIVAIRELNGRMFMGRRLRVCIRQGFNDDTPMYTRYISLHLSFVTSQVEILIDETYLQQLFGSMTSTLQDCVVKHHVLSLRKARQGGYAFLYFSDRTGAETVLQVLSEHRHALYGVTYDAKFSSLPQNASTSTSAAAHHQGHHAGAPEALLKSSADRAGSEHYLESHLAAGNSSTATEAKQLDAAAPLSRSAPHARNTGSRPASTASVARLPHANMHLPHYATQPPQTQTQTPLHLHPHTMGQPLGPHAHPMAHSPPQMSQMSHMHPQTMGHPQTLGHPHHTQQQQSMGQYPVLYVPPPPPALMLPQMLSAHHAHGMQTHHQHAQQQQQQQQPYTMYAYNPYTPSASNTASNAPYDR